MHPLVKRANGTVTPSSVSETMSWTVQVGGKKNKCTLPFNTPLSSPSQTKTKQEGPTTTLLTLETDT